MSDQILISKRMKTFSIFLFRPLHILHGWNHTHRLRAVLCGEKSWNKIVTEIDSSWSFWLNISEHIYTFCIYLNVCRQFLTDETAMRGYCAWEGLKVNVCYYRAKKRVPGTADHWISIERTSTFSPGTLTYPEMISIACGAKIGTFTIATDFIQLIFITNSLPWMPVKKIFHTPITVFWDWHYLFNMIIDGYD